MVRTNTEFIIAVEVHSFHAVTPLMSALTRWRLPKDVFVVELQCLSIFCTDQKRIGGTIYIELLDNGAVQRLVIETKKNVNRI